MRQAQQQLERLAGEPPERRPGPHGVEQQGQRDQRHGGQGRQRDCNHIGQRAVDPGPVEVEQANRHQGQLDHDPGQQDCRELTQPARPQWFLTRCIEGAHWCRSVQRDDRDHRGEAHLETGADNSFGPDQQDQRGGDGDHPHAQRFAPQHQRQHDQHCADARSDRRHFGSGQQGITDPGQRTGPGRRNRQADPQRQPRDQPEQPQRDEIGRRDHRADVQPADREQMRQPGIAHRVLILGRNRPAIAAGKRCRQRAGRTGQVHPHVMRQAALQPPERAIRLPRRDDLGLAQHGPGRRDPGKPRRARKVITARQHRRRRWYQPGAQPQGRSFSELGPVIFLREIDPHDDRPPAVRLARRQSQADPFLRWLLLARDHFAVEPGHHLVRNRPGPDQR